VPIANALMSINVQVRKRVILLCGLFDALLWCTAPLGPCKASCGMRIVLLCAPRTGAELIAHCVDSCWIWCPKCCSSSRLTH
jgi:hypothetical protein